MSKLFILLSMLRWFTLFDVNIYPLIFYNCKSAWYLTSQTANIWQCCHLGLVSILYLLYNSILIITQLFDQQRSVMCKYSPHILLAKLIEHRKTKHRKCSFILHSFTLHTEVMTWRLHHHHSYLFGKCSAETPQQWAITVAPHMEKQTQH